MPADTHAEQPTERLLSPRELSGLLGLGRTSVYSLLTTGEIPSVRIGRLRRVRREDLDRFIEERLERRDG